MTVLYRFAVCIFFCAFCTACAQKSNSSEKKLAKSEKISKINGVSFVASKDSILLGNIEPLKEIGANYAAVMPFAFIKSIDHPEIIYNQERQWFGETKVGVRQYIKMLHKNEIKVMMKPQIWIWDGVFTGLLQMASEEDWLQLEKSYTSFIIDFAEVAKAEKVEILCIGTELEKFIEHRPAYWQKLIAEIKTVYKGKLTYAANWDEYKRVPFWDALDYIGIDAYFPVSHAKTPTVAETVEGWKRWETELKSFSEKENKKILFAEYGFRSVDFAGKEPWKSDREMTSVNLEAQQKLLEGTYQTIWDEDWFAGGFLWKWFIIHEKVGGKTDNQFTPQNKPAEAVVKKYYGKENK